VTLPCASTGSSLPAPKKQTTSWRDEERLRELGGRTSLLQTRCGTPVLLGLALWRANWGGTVSVLGFVVETERQVEARLQSHLNQLPAHDVASRAIVARMKADEVRHAKEAESAGATLLPAPVQGLMRLMAKVMTTVCPPGLSLTQTSTTSKLVVISSGFAQHDAGRAIFVVAHGNGTFHGQSRNGFTLVPTVKCMLILVNTLGSTSARSLVSFDTATAHIVATALQDEHHVISGARRQCQPAAVSMGRGARF
jgi:hypothetical protein